MSRPVSFAAIVALMACFAVAPVRAAEPSGMRNGDDANVNAGRRHHRRSSPQAYDKPWVGHRTDAAGNSYVYYRVGADTPFGPGKSLRGPH